MGVSNTAAPGWFLEHSQQTTTVDYRVPRRFVSSAPPFHPFPSQVPSPTTSPGRRPRSKGQEGFFAGDGPHSDALAVADVVAAEVGCEGVDREALGPFEPIVLEEVSSWPPWVELSPRKTTPMDYPSSR